MIYRMIYHTYRLYRFLGYKSILKSCDSQFHPAVKMASYKKRFVSENETEHVLEESGNEGGDDVFSESENSSESESENGSESENNAEESAVENSESSNSYDTAPPAPKRAKEEGWKWIETGIDHQNFILQEIMG